jgi:hypothetical protein
MTTLTFDWMHVIGVVVVDGEKEASRYVGMVVRAGLDGGVQIRSNRDIVFHITRTGAGARLALMDGDFVRFRYVTIGGSVRRNDRISVMN